MKFPNRGSAACLLPLALLAFASCDGRNGAVANVSDNQARLSLESITYGRLVDVYAYQRIDSSSGGSAGAIRVTPGNARR